MNQIKIITCVIALFVCLTAVAQKKDSVQIINSDTRGVIMLKGYFNEGITKVLLKQLSQKTIATIEKNYNEEDYPECIKSLLNNSNTGNDADVKTAKLFASLKIYRIAIFDNIRNGENFGEESILVVPAKENKNISSSCNYTTDFYIIIPSKDIKLL
jgi:hypothetical protein